MTFYIPDCPSKLYYKRGKHVNIEFHPEIKDVTFYNDVIRFIGLCG